MDQMHPGLGEWRYFKSEEIREALMWAGRGGVSVFEPTVPSHSVPSARLLARDIPTLYAAACELGVGPEFVQAKPHVPELTHFFLLGEFLYKAKQKCPVRLGPVAVQQLQRTPSETKPVPMKPEQHAAKQRRRVRPTGAARK
jgi:hypothetical protein